ncbi:type VI secretion system contractile sheath large subunit [Cronobacter sp. HA18006]|nr:type VI secretion system contractile sheath large subunit [Cronobacter sp. HA18006]
MADASADERVTAAVRVFLERLKQSGQQVEKLDKTLLDHHIAELDRQISRQLDTVMHHPEFQQVESLWRGLKHLVNRTDYRQNVRTEILDIAKEDLRQDFEDAPEIIQSGLYWHTYTAEYDTPGGEPVGAVISSYEFDASAQDMALLRNISKVSAAAHMPFIGAVGPEFFLKDTMEEVAAIKDIGNYFDRAEYIKWKSFRDTDDARYIGLTLPRVLGRLPYGPDTVPVRSFNYVEEVKGPDHEKYLWTSASFAFAANMVKSFINNGWCVQIRGPQAGGAVQDLPIHLYDLGTGNQVKIPSEVMIPETREFEFANLGFIPLSYYKNRDYACFFSANSAQKPALYDTPDATANSRINARLPYIFLLSRIAHYPATFEPGGTDATSQCLLGLVGLGIPGTAEHIATPVSRFLALLGAMRLPTRNAEGIRALVTLLAPDTRAEIHERDPVKVRVTNRSGLGGGERVHLAQRATLGKMARDANSRVLITLFTRNPQEAAGWLPGGQLHTDLLALMRVYLGYRSDARLRLTVPVHLLPEPKLAKHRRIQLGRTGLLGLKGGKLSDNRQCITVSLGCYESLSCTVLPLAAEGSYRFD